MSRKKKSQKPKKKSKKKPKKKMMKRTRVRKVVPDESFTMGPVHGARVGKTVFLQSSMTDEQHRAFIAHAASHHEELCQQISVLAEKVASVVCSTNPLYLLHRAFWELAGAKLAAQNGQGDATDDPGARHRIMEYLQAVVVSVAPDREQQQELDDDQWQQLTDNINEIYNLLLHGYFITKTARDLQAGNREAKEPDAFEVQAQMHWLVVRGERYQNHAADHLSDTLEPQSGILHDLFGVDAQGIVEAFSALSNSLMAGPGEAMARLHELHAKLFADTNAQEVLEQNPGRSLPEIFRQLMVQKGLADEMDDAAAKVSGMDLFDVLKVTSLPEEFVRHLSLEPGHAVGEGGLFDPGAHPGWPLRVLPTWNRPFLAVDGKYYLFDLYRLDRLHYIVGRAVRQLAQARAADWNQNQKEVSEMVPLVLLQRLLRGGRAYRSVYYHWYPRPGSTQKEWCECDGVFLFADWCFVVENKAGTYTYTSPTDDLEAHLNSIRSLVVKPIQQGRRFVDYLRSAASVKLYDSDHREVGELTAASFDRVVVCSITWDQLTQLASTIQFESRFREEMSGEPVWCVSVDDLRVLADLFRTPPEFLHYLQERLRAYGHQALEHATQIDEMDHVGLYFRHSKYVDQLDDHRQGDGSWRVLPAGFDDIVNAYFDGLMLGESPPRPGQSYPSFLEGLVGLLAEIHSPAARKAAFVLLDLEGQAREDWAAAAQRELAQQQQVRRPRHLSLSQTALSFSCSVEPFSKEQKDVLRRKAAVTALIRKATEQVLLFLVGEANGNLVSANTEEVRIDDLSPEEKADVEHEATLVAAKKVEDYKGKHGKIGRNEKCPCGSGEKYKECHGK